MSMKWFPVIVIGLLLTLPVKADYVSDEAYKMIPSIKEWLYSDIVVQGINKQNQRHSALSMREVNDLDKQWRTELKSEEKSLINQVMSSALSEYLKSVKSNAEGTYTEIFVMDNKGLNVGQSDVTSDYWQGDEAKWQKTFLADQDAVQVSEVTFDESAKKYQSQVSLPITDPATGEMIGAATVGVYVNALIKKAK